MGTLKHVWAWLTQIGSLRLHFVWSDMGAKNLNDPPICTDDFRDWPEKLGNEEAISVSSAWSNMP